MIKSEDAPNYAANTDIVRQALDILERRLQKPGSFIGCPQDVKDYVVLQLAEERDEVFCALFLNQRHEILGVERLFTGTVNGCQVYPRAVVRKALELNAAAVIFVHNHPSGNAEPSKADDAITARLKGALEHIDVRTLDHIIVAGTSTCSYAESKNHVLAKL